MERGRPDGKYKQAFLELWLGSSHNLLGFIRAIDVEWGLGDESACPGPGFLYLSVLLSILASSPEYKPGADRPLKGCLSVCRSYQGDRLAFGRGPVLTSVQASPTAAQSPSHDYNQLLLFKK